MADLNVASTDLTPSLLSIKCLRTLSDPANIFSARAWHTSPHPTLPILATAASDKTVQIYSLVGSSDKPVSSITGGHKRSIRSTAWKPNLKGESVLATASFDASIGIWRRWEDEDNLAKRQPQTIIRQGIGATGIETFEVEIKSQGRAAKQNYHDDDDDDVDDGSTDSSKEEEWRYAVVLDGHDSEVKSVAWSAGGNLLATCSRDKSVWIWEETADDEFETVAVLQEHEGDVKCVAWHPEEEMVASASYDDEIRLWKDEGDDWTCIWVGRGHTSTVWSVAWEALSPRIYERDDAVYSRETNPKSGNESIEDMARKHKEDPQKQEQIAKKERDLWFQERTKCGPRLLSCSDDRSIRAWRRRPKERVQHHNRLSIIRSGDFGEDWFEEAILPSAHDRAIYAVAWSPISGHVVSVGGDGRIVVYREEWDEQNVADESTDASDNIFRPLDDPSEEIDNLMPPHIRKSMPSESGSENKQTSQRSGRTRWRIIAQTEAAHEFYEINHVAWTQMPVSSSATPQSDARTSISHGNTKEVIITTGDEGAVKVWEIQ